MRHIVPILTATLLAPPVAAADPFADVARLEVLPGWQTAQGTHMTGIRVTLRPGWHTYWRAPGDAGIPPQFSWDGSENIATARFHWPTPHVMDQNTMQVIGYYDSLVLPIEVQPSVTGAPITIAGDVLLGVCEDICIPVNLSFAADLPLQGARDSAIVAALLNQPLDADEAGVRDATCQVTPSQDSMQVTATLTMPSAGGDETVVIEPGNPEVWVSPSDVTRDGEQLVASVDMVHTLGSAFALDRSQIRITVLGSDHAVDVIGCSAG